MTIREIQAKAGPPLGYLGYFFLMFVWYFLQNIYSSMGDAVPDSSEKALLDWGLRLVIGPLISAGVFGGMHEQQPTPHIWSPRAFLGGIKRYYWRMLVTSLLYIVVSVIAVLILGVAGLNPIDSAQNRPLII